MSYDARKHLHECFFEGIDNYTEKYDYFMGSAERMALTKSIMDQLSNNGFGFVSPISHEESTIMQPIDDDIIAAYILSKVLKCDRELAKGIISDLAKEGWELREFKYHMTESRWAQMAEEEKIGKSGD